MNETVSDGELIELQNLWEKWQANRFSARPSLKIARIYSNARKADLANAVPSLIKEIQSYRSTANEHARTDAPVNMLLFCPRCFEQHVDAPEPNVCKGCGIDVDAHDGSGCAEFTAWMNPSHTSHRCGSCNHVWRQSDNPTNGVQSLETKGKADGSAKPVAFASGKDFDEAVRYATTTARTK